MLARAQLAGRAAGECPRRPLASREPVGGRSPLRPLGVPPEAAPPAGPRPGGGRRAAAGGGSGPRRAGPGAAPPRFRRRPRGGGRLPPHRPPRRGHRHLRLLAPSRPRAAGRSPRRARPAREPSWRWSRPFSSWPRAAAAGLASRRKVVYRYEDLAPHVRRIVERERVKAEIDAANRIQAALLPPQRPSAPRRDRRVALRRGDGDRRRLLRLPPAPRRPPGPRLRRRRRARPDERHRHGDGEGRAPRPG